MAKDKAKGKGKAEKKAEPAKAKRAKRDIHTGAAKTARNKQRILDHLDEHGDFVTTACLNLKLSRAQFYRWIDPNHDHFDSEFAERYTEIKEKHVDLMEANLVEIANNAERDSDRVRAIESYLRARAKDRGYGVEKREQKHEGEVALGGVQLNLFLPDNGKAAKLDK